MDFDLVVIGDGIFANVFLFELNKLVNKSQNFSVAKIFSEELAPNCSLRTTSTVSKNGIEEGISELGDLLVKSFEAFQQFSNEHQNVGIYPSKQYVASTHSKTEEKIQKRYGDKVSKLSQSYFKKNYLGVELDSYIVIPEEFFSGLNSYPKNYQLKSIQSFVKFFEEKEDGVAIHLLNGDVITAKKCVVATGAFSRLFSDMFTETEIKEKILNTKIVAGTYLIKKASFPNDIYLTLNGHNLVYRKSTSELIIGSTTVEGPITLPMMVELKEIFEDVKKSVTLDIGNFEDYTPVTGLRHKGQKRMPYFKPITKNQRVWFFNGAYKNGWSLPFYLAKKEAHLFC